MSQPKLSTITDLLVLLYFIPSLLAVVRFIAFVPKSREGFPFWLRVISDIATMVALPGFLLFISLDTPQDCCNQDGTSLFAQQHLLTIVVWWLLGLCAYGYVQYRRGIGSPVGEVLSGWVLLFSVVLNLFIMVHERDFAYLFCVPIVLFLLMALTNHHRRVRPRLRRLTDPGTLDAIALPSEEPARADVPPDEGWQRYLRPLLELPVLAKYPALLILFSPLFLLVATVLLLFGQRPDSFLLAFTQTYHLGLSELTPLCEGVQCGGHYLCSVAAGGHPRVVRPVRYGVRGGKVIVCNRQLLVANAFEEVLQERFPAAHRRIRRGYDRVGDFIHKDYTPYENKYLCDVIYLLMKPADWVFRLVLYTVDREPEERIARQYLSLPGPVTID